MQTLIVLCFIVSTLQSFDTFAFFNAINTATGPTVSLSILGGMISVNDSILVSEASRYVGIMGIISLALWVFTMTLYIQYYRNKNKSK